MASAGHSGLILEMCMLYCCYGNIFRHHQPLENGSGMPLVPQYVFSHYSDVIMGTMMSQISSLAIVFSTVYSGADQRKHQSSASLAFVRGIHRWPEFPTQRASNAEMFPFDDVTMCSAIHLPLLHTTASHTSQWLCTRFMLCCVLLWLHIGRNYPYSKGLLRWDWGNHTIVPLPIKQP